MAPIAPLTIGQLARKAGVDVASIRLYEEKGLLPKPRRRRGRHGDIAYHQEHLDRLIFIRRALALGLGFEAIAELANINGGLQTCNDVYRTVNRHLAARRDSKSTDGEQTLRALVASCPRKGNRNDCVVISALSRRDE